MAKLINSPHQKQIGDNLRLDPIDQRQTNIVTGQIGSSLRLDPIHCCAVDLDAVLKGERDLSSYAKQKG